MAFDAISSRPGRQEAFERKAHDAAALKPFRLRAREIREKLEVDLEEPRQFEMPYRGQVRFTAKVVASGFHIRDRLVPAPKLETHVARLLQAAEKGSRELQEASQANPDRAAILGILAERGEIVVDPEKHQSRRPEMAESDYPEFLREFRRKGNP